MYVPMFDVEQATGDSHRCGMWSYSFPFPHWHVFACGAGAAEVELTQYSRSSSRRGHGQVRQAGSSTFVLLFLVRILYFCFFCTLRLGSQWDLDAFCLDMFSHTGITPFH